MPRHIHIHVHRQTRDKRRARDAGNKSKAVSYLTSKGFSSSQIDQFFASTEGKRIDRAMTSVDIDEAAIDRAIARWQGGSQIYEDRKARDCSCGGAAKDKAGERFVHAEQQGEHSVKVYFNSELKEFVCRLFKGATEINNAEYFTNDKSDALSTAKDMLRRAVEASGKLANTK